MKTLCFYIFLKTREIKRKFFDCVKSLIVLKCSTVMKKLFEKRQFWKMKTKFLIQKISFSALNSCELKKNLLTLLNGFSFLQLKKESQRIITSKVAATGFFHCRIVENWKMPPKTARRNKIWQYFFTVATFSSDISNFHATLTLNSPFMEISR